MGGEPGFEVKVFDGTKEVKATGFTPEHTVEEVVAYAIEHLGTKWPKGGDENVRGYTIDGSTVRPWADASEEELGERCNLSGEPSTITLESDGTVGC